MMYHSMTVWTSIYICFIINIEHSGFIHALSIYWFVSFSLSLYIYIYIYVHACVCIEREREREERSLELIFDLESLTKGPIDAYMHRYIFKVVCHIKVAFITYLNVKLPVVCQTVIYISRNTPHTHTHTHIYIYIYIYI